MSGVHWSSPFAGVAVPFMVQKLAQSEGKWRGLEGSSEGDGTGNVGTERWTGLRYSQDIPGSCWQAEGQGPCCVCALGDRAYGVGTPRADPMGGSYWIWGEEPLRDPIPLHGSYPSI